MNIDEHRIWSGVGAITAFLKSVPRFCPKPRTLATAYSGHVHHFGLFLALMKRPSGPSTPKTRLISRQSSADPAVTLFKLEDLDSDSEPGPSASPRRSKRVKVEDVYGDRGGGEFSISTAKVADKGKKARSGRTPSRSPQKPKAIKQALEKPHPAPEKWRETYESIKEMRSRFPAPVDTMGCDTAKWKEMDPRVRDTRDGRPFYLSRPLGPYFFFIMTVE